MKLTLPTKSSDISRFYAEHKDLIMPPSKIGEHFEKSEAYNRTDSVILLGLILARLAGIDVEMFKSKNSDVRLEVGERPVFLDGKKQEWHRDERFPVITAKMMDYFVSILTPEEVQSVITHKRAHLNREDLDEDFAVSFEINPNFDYNQVKKDESIYFQKPQFLVSSTSFDQSLVVGRFRVNLARAQRKSFIVLRTIPADIPDFYELGLNPKFLDFIHYDKGLVIVTGPTGSGKSTTLASIMDQVNKTQRKNIITIEDPVEFVHKNNKSFFFQREVPGDTASFASGLRSALREHPDIILVGELRDLETIRLAIEAAETGHLVFCTLHTFNAAKTIDRIINSFPETEQNKVALSLAGAFLGIISQTLVKTQEGGITALNEMIKATDGVKQHIALGESSKVSQAAAHNPAECIMMKEHGYQLIEKGIVSQKEILGTLYRNDVNTYNELKERLRASSIYDPLLDPYSEHSMLAKGDGNDGDQKQTPINKINLNL